ncbi:helix-turn-helix domain-containing protein [Flavonifractor plautii]
MERIEEETIRTMFDRCRGNVSQCATCLHMKRQTLQHKLKKYGILY